LKIISINIAIASNVSFDGRAKKYKSGIFKNPVDQLILLDHLGFVGDSVGDSKIHGGKDKAICAYCVEHYPYWSEILQRKIGPGSFGENLSLGGMPETVVNIGDVFKLGTAQIQVSQPRQPCHKLNKIFKDQSMSCRIQKSGFSGYYFRVLEPGRVEPSSFLNRIRKGPGEFSIERVNALFLKGGANVQEMEELISIEALSDSYKEMTLKRLNKLRPSQVSS
jgi:MOSC domain-containing protein YiiM